MTTTITLRAPNGTPLSARVDVDARGIVLHSRSGRDRNRDYRQALELLISRLDAAGLSYEFYLDSSPVQQLPLERRRLDVPRRAAFTDQFNTLVREMNDGSSSNGAWRRILISVPEVNPTSLPSVLVGTIDGADGPELGLGGQ